MLAVHLAVSGAAHSKRNRDPRFPAPSLGKMNEMEGLPISKNFDLVGSRKAVVAVEADYNGARLAAGGTDYMCHLYDFGGLKSDGKSFRSFEVTEGHPVVAVSETGRSALPQQHLPLVAAARRQRRRLLPAGPRACLAPLLFPKPNCCDVRRPLVQPL